MTGTGPANADDVVIADLRTRLAAARQRIDVAQAALTGAAQRDALRSAVESIRRRLAELERQHDAALTAIRADAEAHAAAIRAGAGEGDPA